MANWKIKDNFDYNIEYANVYNYHITNHGVIIKKKRSSKLCTHLSRDQLYLYR